MARGRLIAKSLSTSRKYAALQAVAGDLGEFCQMLYPLLVIHSDDYGRLPGDLFTVKHLIVPASPRTESDLGRALVHLDAVGLIQWYDHDGRKWIQIEQFDVHQVNLHKRTAPTSPAPPQTNGSPEIPGPPGNSGLRAQTRRLILWKTPDPGNRSRT
jgi:hypothetical protein